MSCNLNTKSCKIQDLDEESQIDNDSLYIKDLYDMCRQESPIYHEIKQLSSVVYEAIWLYIVDPKSQKIVNRLDHEIPNEFIYDEEVPDKLIHPWTTYYSRITVKDDYVINISTKVQRFVEDDSTYQEFKLLEMEQTQIYQVCNNKFQLIQKDSTIIFDLRDSMDIWIEQSRQKMND